MTRKRDKAKILAVAALCLATAGFGGLEPFQTLPRTAQRVYSYYTALERNAQPMPWWDRVTYSLILAGSDLRMANRNAGRT